MDKLVTLQEVQALTALFSKTPMTPAELLWANMFASRLFQYAQPAPPPKPDLKQPLETPERPDLGGAMGPEDLDIKQPGAGENANGNQE